MATSLYCRKCGTRLSSDTQFCSTCGMSQAEIAHSSVRTQQSESDSFQFSTGMLPPTRLLNQRYRLIETVGRGGMGAVYSAQDTQLGNRLVALKEMSLSRLSPQDYPLVMEQFRREAHLLAGLHHPYLPAIHEYFSENGRWYLVMSFIEGQTLYAILNATSGKRLPVKEVVRIGIELCEVLDYLHTNKPPIIFRDLKPLNIMMTPKGHICLIDFGIARHFKQEQANDTAHFYSVGYAPPEQYGRSQTSPRSDIYSLGATLHQMLSGQNPSHHPFQFAPLQQLDATIPVPLVSLVRQMVEMDEHKRPVRVATIKQQLEQILVLEQSEPVGSIESETLVRNSRLWLQEQGTHSSSHDVPTSHSSTTSPQPMYPSQEERVRARPLVRRSILMGLLGGIIIAGSGTWVLSRPLGNADKTGSNTPTPAKNTAPALTPKTTPAPTPAGNGATWTHLQRIFGQASKTTPALAVSSNGTLHQVFVANNDGNGLLHISSQDKGVTWGNYYTVPNQSSKTAPALTISSNGTLHLVYTANDGSGGLFYTSSQNQGTTWASASPINELSKSAPTLTISSNGTLYLAFVADNDGNGMLYASSQDQGTTWANASPIPNQSSKTAPALAVSSDGTLHVVYTANDGSGLLYTSSHDQGATWSSAYYAGQSSPLAPALTILNNTLYLAFVANDGSNQIYVISSQDGIHWSGRQKVGQASLYAPALAVLNGKLYLAFIANDGSNQLSIISSQE